MERHVRHHHEENRVRGGFRIGGLTALRVVVGIIFIVHGWVKLADMPAWQSQMDAMGFPAVGVLSWLAMLAELGGGLLLLLGLLTPLAAAATATNMFVAVFWVHLDNGLLAQNNGFEFPLTLGLVSLYFLFRGAGPVSLDALLRERARRRKSGTEATRHEREEREGKVGRGVRVHGPGERGPAHVTG